MGPKITRALRTSRAAARVLGLAAVASLLAGPAASPRAGAPRLAGQPAPPSLASLRLAPEAGRFLVAAQGMRDPRFARTVILIITHDGGGTMGLVINKPTRVPLSEALPEIAWRESGPRLLFLGGPVLPQGVSYLLRSEKPPAPSRRVVDGVFHSASLSLLAEAAGREDAATALRVFAGHAGWAPGQLDGELRRRDWHVLIAKAEDVFRDPPSELWPELIQRAEAEWVSLPGRTRVGRSGAPPPSMEGASLRSRGSRGRARR